MTVGEQFIIAVLNEESELFLSKVNKNWMSPDEQKYHGFVTDYYRDNGKLPTLSVFEDKFGVFDEVSGTPKHYLSELKNRHIYTHTVENMPKLLKDMKKDPMRVFDEIKTVINNAGVDMEDTIDIPYEKSASSRFDKYKDKIGTGGITYISTGDPVLDALLHGYQKTDLITMGGFPGVGKTWWLLFQALICEASLPDDAGPILVISNEMGEEEIIDRLDCIRFKLDYSRFIEGTLLRKQVKRYKDGLEELEDKGSRIIVLDNCVTIQDIDYKIGLYKPSIIMIDGSYLLEPRMKADDWKRIMFITRNLKMLCKTRNVPIINTTQLKRKSGRDESKSSVDAQDDFAYGGSFVQDSDVAIRAYQSADMQYNSVVGFEFAKGRRLPPDTKLSWKRNVVEADYGYSSIEAVADLEEGEVEY